MRLELGILALIPGSGNVAWREASGLRSSPGIDEASGCGGPTVDREWDRCDHNLQQQSVHDGAIAKELQQPCGPHHMSEAVSDKRCANENEPTPIAAPGTPTLPASARGTPQVSMSSA